MPSPAGLTLPQPRAIVMHTMNIVSPPVRRCLGRLLAVVLLAWGAAGCVRMEQALTLNGDGSGNLAIRYGMSLKDLAELEATAKQQLAEEGMTSEGPVNPFEFDEAEVRKDFEDYAELGVSLKSIKTSEEDGWKYLSLNIAFKTLAGLGQTEFLSDRIVSLKRLADGRYEFVQSVPPQAQPGPPEMQDLMKEMMKGFRAALRVTVPGEVVETNADQTDGRTVSWSFDLDKDAKALERIQKASMRVVFQGEGLELAEFSGSAEAGE